MIALVALVLGAGQEFPVELPLPVGADPATLVVRWDGKEGPVQVDGTSAVFLLPERHGIPSLGTGTPPPGSPKVEVKDVDGRHLLLSYGGKQILRYNYGTVRPPDGVDPVFERSGYIHPLFTPSGKILTNDSPKNHLHHHGIWWAWTSSQFEGRKSNFWESAEKQGKIECVKVEGTVSGPVFGGFKARHRFINLNGPGGPKVALEELWEVRVYAITDRFIVDLVSTQTCATEQPLLIKEYRYGGVGFRGANDWEGKDGAVFLTSEGKSRVDGHATRAKWCLMSGKLGGADASIAFLAHPSDFRFPQPMRIHPDEPFFNWAIPQGGDFSIEPGKPLVSRYRFIVSDGVPAGGRVEAHWKAYADPTGFLGSGR